MTGTAILQVNVANMWWQQQPHVLDAFIVPEISNNRSVDTAAIARIVERIRQSPVAASGFSAYEVRASVTDRVSRLAVYMGTLKSLMDGNRGIEQRTPEWYAARNNLITASDAAQAIGEGKFGTRREFFEKKLDAILSAEPKTLNMNIPPLQWGVKYEPVAAYLYEELYSTVLHEFGLLVHPVHACIGASPDGISAAGIMVEIKCPYRRKISGDIPGQYFLQMQLQMDVCGLRECDYLECEIEESSIPDVEEKFVGAVIDRNGKYTYEFGFGRQSVDLAKLPLLEPGAKRRYFAVSKYNIIRVKRDDRYLESKISLLKSTWADLQKILINRRESNSSSSSSPLISSSSSCEQQPQKKKKNSWMFVDSDDDN